MKSRFLILLASLIINENVLSYSILDPDPVAVWPLNSFPVQVTIDNLYLPNNVPNTPFRVTVLVLALVLGILEKRTQ